MPICPLCRASYLEGEPHTCVESTRRIHVDWKYLFLWVLACIVGYAFAMVILGLKGGYSVLVWAVGGLTVGTIQWFILRRRLSDAGWWILATSVGWALYPIIPTVPIFVVVTMLMASSSLIDSLVSGAMVGIMQWIILAFHFSKAVWWLFASIVGYILGTVVVNAVVGMTNGVSKALEGGVVFGCVYGGITGLVLMMLLRQPIPRHDRAT